jgi:hypothetical protein
MHATQLRLALALAFRRVTLFAFAQFATVARAVADDNARAGPVFISGATGPFAAAINGFYGVTEEKSLDGHLLLIKRSDPSMCIEHYRRKWQVKPVSDKGKDQCKAYVAGGCALEDCASRVWKVDDGKGFDDQPSVKMATGSEAERQVSGGCMRATQLHLAFYLTSILFCRQKLAFHLRPRLPMLQWCGHVDFHPISRLTRAPAPGLVRALRLQSGIQEMGHGVDHDVKHLHGVRQHRRESRQQSARGRQFNRWNCSHAHRWLRVRCSCSRRQAARHVCVISCVIWCT